MESLEEFGAKQLLDSTEEVFRLGEQTSEASKRGRQVSEVVKARNGENVR